MIWCVEDDTAIRDIEVYTLCATGYEAKGFPDGESLMWELKKEKPELIILDIMLPETDGLEILKRLRSSAATSSIPVILATAKGMEYDKVKGLDLGADDYLVKPFGMMEMVSRVRAVLRRCERENTQILKNGGIQIDTTMRSVMSDGMQTELTYKEYELLLLFMRHPGMVFSREQIFEQVWGEDFMGETRTLDMHIRTLRQKLKEQGKRIRTVRKVGYQLEEER